jgi:spore coat polysaccharide biosynthesis protein SpsF
VCLLTPKDDPLLKFYGNKRNLDIVEGSEDDVLSRYNKAMNELNPDLMVRITSDCPLIPPSTISDHIINTDKYRYDYASNVDPRFRHAPDGWDCEVMTSRMMKWLGDNAKDPSDKEHVTTLARRRPPKWARIGAVMCDEDFSSLKFSVDTQEDLEHIRERKASRNVKVENAKNKEICDGYHFS